jgi:hypothetical protein
MYFRGQVEITGTAFSSTKNFGIRIISEHAD